MKYINMKKKYQPLNLQLFAEESGENDSNSEDAGEGNGQNEDDSDKDGESNRDEDNEEKKFSQKDVDEAVKKQLARERRKWQREQQRKTDSDEETKDGSSRNDKEAKKLKERAAKADELELKWTCLEHDVEKTCVDDVLALAKVHMAKDADMDIEEAIDAVLKKYPQFKENASKKDGMEKSWGERHSGQRKKSDGVTNAFLKKNPGLKID